MVAIALSKGYRSNVARWINHVELEHSSSDIAKHQRDDKVRARQAEKYLTGAVRWFCGDND